MRTIKLTIEYEGTRYHGWQSQKKHTTVQRVIEDKLSIILNQPTRVIGSGRTDAGVHALSQVAHFQTKSQMEAADLKRGLNSLLPSDIIIKDVSEERPLFHARYSALRRTYRYLIWNEALPSIFLTRFAWHVPTPLDIEKMRGASQCLLGTHDFSSFQGAGTKAASPVREIYVISIERSERGLIIFTIEASAFLRHMVRNIMGTLLDVGTGKRTVREFHTILKAKDRKKAGKTAPPQGLYLKEVRYE